MFSVYPVPSWWLREYIALSYYHHQIGSVNYYPLFRIKSWNNGMRCMSLYILIHAPVTLMISQKLNNIQICWKYTSLLFIDWSNGMKFYIYHNNIWYVQISTWPDWYQNKINIFWSNFKSKGDFISGTDARCHDTIYIFYLSLGNMVEILYNLLSYPNKHSSSKWVHEHGWGLVCLPITTLLPHGSKDSPISSWCIIQQLCH